MFEPFGNHHFSTVSVALFCYVNIHLQLQTVNVTL